MRPALALRATLRAPFHLRPPATNFSARMKQLLVDPAAANTNKWSPDHLQLLRLQFIRVEPFQISARYGREPLAPDSSELLELKSERGVVRSISKWLRVIQSGKDEAGSEDKATVDHFVGELLHAVDIDSGDKFELLPQRIIRQKIAGFEFVTKPDFILLDDANLIDLVTHESKARGATDKAWPQVAGEMLLTALRNMREGADDDFDLFGMRAVGTLFTFFRCSFQAAKLARLDSGELKPDESFDIYTWAGTHVDCRNDCATGRWGLDFLIPAERKQIIDMITAIAADLRER